MGFHVAAKGIADEADLCGGAMAAHRGCSGAPIGERDCPGRGKRLHAVRAGD